MIYEKLYLCDMNIDKASYQLRQSNQIMLDKRSFVRGISKLGGKPNGFSTQRAICKMQITSQIARTVIGHFRTTA